VIKRRITSGGGAADLNVLSSSAQPLVCMTSATVGNRAATGSPRFTAPAGSDSFRLIGDEASAQVVLHSGVLRSP